MLNKLTLKSKFHVLIVVVFIALLVVLFGVRLMGKVTSMAYYEREHIVSVANINHELLKSKVDRKQLLLYVSMAYQQPVNIDESIFGVEKFLFRVLGQGSLLDAAVRDEQELGEILRFLEQIPVKFLTINQVDKMDVLMKGPRQYTETFGKGLRGAANMVKTIVILLVFITVGSTIMLLINMMHSTLPALEQTVMIIKKIAEGDLNVKFNEFCTGEIGQMQSSIIDMINGLQSMVHNVSEVEKELSETASNAFIITGQTLQGIKVQKRESEQLSSSLNEMSAAIVEVANAASNAATASNNGNQSAIRGKEVVAEAVASITALANDVEDSVEAIHQIESNSENISTVVSIIEVITDQTNLLALNAAIEAAQAGEYGRGFSVVADEVRTLAQRTSDSTKEIQNMVNELQNSTQQAVEILERSHIQMKTSVEKASQVNDVIEEIASSVSTITMLNAQIATASEEQISVISEIDHNADVIQEVAEQAEIGGMKVAQSNDRLVVLSKQLADAVGKFKF